ncbi:MAG: DNA polymerase III subunit epsilon [Bauldia sp.]|nr:DNA polymerase III subunit epsilon [Bauldia sp.]
MREVAFDTETTGLDVASDRIIEIGCVELINHIPSGRTFQAYLNPQRQISNDSFLVHGISEQFLADKPLFGAIADEFLEFIGDDPLVAHNADFDYGFINAELARASRPPLSATRVVDSLALARRRHPAGPNSLDALCSRYGIDRSKRTVHGALLDAGLLGEVYIELLGGRQASLLLGDLDRRDQPLSLFAMRSSRVRPVPRPLSVSDTERAAHAALMATIGNGGLWAGYGAVVAVAAA